MTTTGELIMLRELVRKQTEELTAKDKLIEKQNITIARQDIRIENMVQALLHAQKRQFGTSSETVRGMEGQLHLFETAQGLADELLKEQQQITVSTHKRSPRKPGVREDMLSGLPKEVVEYIIPADENCPVCDTGMKVIARQLVRTEVEFIPARLKVVQVVREVAKCPMCGTDKSPHEKSYFKRAAIPASILPHSIATPSIVGQVLYQKYHLGVPLSRQEKDWYRLGLVLPRSVMANWVIRSGASEPVKASFFHYSSTRNGDIARRLLSGYHGYLTTDAYSGYEKVDNIKRNLCWSHVRRYYIESIPLDKNGKEIPGSKGSEGRDFIDLLFKIEKVIKDPDYEEKKNKRQVASRAIFDAFWEWVEETSALATTNEKLTKALTYASNQRKYLETFLDDGRLAISNNLCEANIKPYATGRRAWLFADSQQGARANAIVYTLTESAKINHLEVYGYIKYLLTSMPNIDYNNQPELLDRYLPWSENLPDECRFTKTIEKRLK